MTVPDSRLAQIKSWLYSQLSEDEARLHYIELERETTSLIGSSGGWVAYFEKKLVSKYQQGDEFWLYDASREEWGHLYGERGMALVRKGNVLTFILECRN